MLAFAAASALALAALDPAGPGFDCAKASTPDEKLVCEVRELARLDRRMAVLWSWKLARADEEKHAAARNFQRSWLAKRASCAKAAGREAQVACVRELYRVRIADLEKGMGPVPDAILVLHRVHEPRQRGCEEVTVSWPELTGTTLEGASAFNAFFADEKHEPECMEPDLPGADSARYHQRSSLTWTNGRFVTFQRGTQTDGTGAHSNFYSEIVTFDLERGQVGPGEVFSDTPAVRAKLVALLEQRLRPSEPDRLAEKAFEPGHWAFTAEGATVHFSPYEIGSYADGDYEATFTWKALRPFLAEDSPFPLR